MPPAKAGGGFKSKAPSRGDERNKRQNEKRAN